MSGRDLLTLSFRLIAALFFAVAIGVVVQVLLFLGGSTRTEGMVVSLATVENSIRFVGGDEPTGVLYYPVVAYPGDDGVVYEITGRRGTSRPVYHPGEAVGVIYRDADPSDARLDTFMGIWGSAVILAACGLVFLLISVVAPLGFGGRPKEDQR